MGILVKQKLGQFDEFYYACGSGTLVRCLQNSGLAKKYFAIGVTARNPQIGKAIIYYHNQSFDEIVEDQYKPPFNSAIHYDAKAWKYAFQNYGTNKKILFWNVF